MIDFLIFKVKYGIKQGQLQGVNAVVNICLSEAKIQHKKLKPIRINDLIIIP